MNVLPCKFCGAKGKASNQGGLDGIPEWEVAVKHKDNCVVRGKGIIQDGVTWHSLHDWTNFYSGFYLNTRKAWAPRPTRKKKKHQSILCTKNHRACGHDDACLRRAYVKGVKDGLRKAQANETVIV